MPGVHARESNGVRVIPTVQLQSAIEKLRHGAEKTEWSTDLTPEECAVVLAEIEDEEWEEGQ